MLIRRAENRDITQINNLLKQVCLVHHKGRPDLFKKGARKYSDDLCVDENSRGQHIGKQLYEYSKDFAQKSGCYNLTLNVWSCNESAMKFYESCGLKPQKVHMETIFDKS